MAHPHITTDKPPTGRPRCSIIIGGCGTSWKGKIRERPNMHIKLKRILLDAGLSNKAMGDKIIKADGAPLSRTAINQTLNKGYIPGTVPNFTGQVEAVLREMGVQESIIATVWEPETESNIVPFKTTRLMHKQHAANVFSDSLDNSFAETLKEAEMLTPTTTHHFKLFRNPFLDDVQKSEDVFMSESHRYAYAAMLDAAHNGGFVAICGECGAGKSIMRRKLISELVEAGDCRVIEPQTIDKRDLTSGHILDAIILDLDPNAKLRQTREAKARQVRSALLASSRAGMRHVLIIEEAHDLSVPTMKQLKRLWEIEDGYSKILGIVLVGQTELQNNLNRQNHPEMREVILRCLIGTLDSLNRADCEAYIALKFNRIGKPMADVLADGCMDAVMARLTTRGGYPTVYPLYINNLLAKAMNAAAQIGAPLVTTEIIEGV